LKSLGRFDEAVKDFTSAIDLDPVYVRAYIERGRVHLLTGDSGEALRDVDAALDIDPGSAEALEFRATIYRGMGRLDDALADANTSIELVPRAGTYHTRGLIYRDLGEEERARADFTYACGMGMSEACDALTEGD